MKQYRTHILIIGTGAAGLNAAVRLQELGEQDVLIFSEGLKMGTSINTGSDKQTYYKLGMYGSEPDSPEAMAADLSAGGSVHGDIALTEAALSMPAFFHLAAMGVDFPHDSYGQYIGYKTDHDPKRRAVSCGPYTSRDMCRALIKKLQQNGTTFFEYRCAIKLLKDHDTCCGAIFINWNAESQEDTFEVVQADHVIFACGGPGGLYARSVYPKVHTGAIGLALEIGARARNLPESQYGMASVKFRWNVSGSYMQVLPRFISRNADGSDEQEFLRSWFPSTAAMYDTIFLKGYQWPFSAGNLPGSSLIDLILYIETEIKGRHVFLDYRTDPPDFDFNALSETTRTYLEKSHAWGNTPYERLQQLNAPAIELFRDHKIDLQTEPLEIAVCAQHNNGGLAANIWWESENIHRLYPIGEINGSHGITRPGGSALNAGQVGAFRTAEYISAVGSEPSQANFQQALQNAWGSLQERLARPVDTDWRQVRQELQNRMSLAGSFLREAETIRRALAETEQALEKNHQSGLAGADTKTMSEILRNDSLLEAQKMYLSAILFQIESGTGSRGGAAVPSSDGEMVHPALPWRFARENTAFRNQVLETTDSPDGIVNQWSPCRPIPHCDGWFEQVWHACRAKKIYDKEPII